MIWSAIPGASRHHWGTDFDIYDASVKECNQVSLTVLECQSEFKNMYEWLDRNLNHYSFSRPYILDKGGVAKEPWHLSYSPLANKYFEEYTLDIFIKNIEDSNILLKELILKDAQLIFNQFVKNIT
jgi:hypothetical protein